MVTRAQRDKVSNLRSHSQGFPRLKACPGVACSLTHSTVRVPEDKEEWPCAQPISKDKGTFTLLGSVRAENGSAQQSSGHRRDSSISTKFVACSLIYLRLHLELGNPPMGSFSSSISRHYKWGAGGRGKAVFKASNYPRR